MADGAISDVAACAPPRAARAAGGGSSARRLTGVARARASMSRCGAARVPPGRRSGAARALLRRRLRAARPPLAHRRARASRARLGAAWTPLLRGSGVVRDTHTVRRAATLASAWCTVHTAYGRPRGARSRCLTRVGSALRLLLRRPSAPPLCRALLFVLPSLAFSWWNEHNTVGRVAFMQRTQAVTQVGSRGARSKAHATL